MVFFVKKVVCIFGIGIIQIEYFVVENNICYCLYWFEIWEVLMFMNSLWFCRNYKMKEIDLDMMFELEIYRVCIY